MIDQDRRPNTVNATAIAGWGTLLLVEDDPTVVKVTQAMLEKLGYDVLTAKDGEEATETLEGYAHLIRLVVSDLDLPRRNGWDVLAAVRRIRPEIPVVLVSGYDEIAALPPWSDVRPPAFLKKPYGLAALRSILETALIQSFQSALDRRRFLSDCAFRS